MNLPEKDFASLIGLMLLIERLVQSGIPLGRAALLPFAEMKLPKVFLEYEMLVDFLLKERLIEGDADAFTLTFSGNQLLLAVASEHSLHSIFYNEYYQAIRASQAHSLFCERVYGKDLGQHGMADMEQIHAALSVLGVAAGRLLLDFGCGDGQISEYIAQLTEANVTGVDIASEAIRLAQERTAGKRDRLRFYCADLERAPQTFPAMHFDHILAIDSLFFARDQQLLAQYLLERLVPGGKIGVFYVAPPGTAANETTLARALDVLGVAYQARDHSAQNRQHWLKKKQVLMELEPLFQAEGSGFLYKNRLAECDGMVDFQRYLFLIEKDSPA